MVIRVGRPSPFAARVIVAAACAASLLVTGGCKWFQKSPPAEPAASETPAPTAVTPSDQQTLEQIAASLDTVEQKQRDAGAQLDAQLGKYKEKGGQLPAGAATDLTPAQADELAKRVEQERGGRKQLLEDILKKDEEIERLKKEVESIKAKLPNTESVVVGEGARHDRIAMDYLIKRGVKADKAYGIVSQINLFDGLVPGFRVWVMYNASNGQFGTWVTQGTAKITPQAHQKRVVSLLEEELAATKQANETLLTKLQSTSDELDVAKADVESKAAEVDSARAAAEEAERLRVVAENTVLYQVGSKKQLQDAKIIDRGFKLLRGDLPGAAKINLADADALPTISAGSVGLKKIKKATVAPRDLVLNRDYQVQFDMDGASATVRILDKERFKRTRLFVVALED